MASMKLTILIASLALATAYPPEAVPNTRNTIFGDERLEGEVFEFVDKSVFTNEVATRNDEDNPYRLPTTTKPNRYTVLWATDFPNFAIGGTVAIELEANEAGVSEIVIHSEDLIINSAVLTQGATVIPINVVEQPEYQFLRIQLQTGNLVYSPVTPIVYVLTINFEGSMRTDMYGIYRSWFTSNGTTSWMATTQFQATAGRRAFPCYDEPSFKAYFDITLRRPAAYRSWSCTKIANTTTSVIQGFEEDRYLTTPYMSTYLIAVIIAEYDSLEVFNAAGELVYEVIARPDAINDNQGQYALDVGQVLLAEMSDHTGIDFYSVSPNLKMTQAAIPDFGAGAMENWGLLTYREAYLLHNEEETSGYFKQLIAYILSHEIAHMWFGNLVTCDWWDVLWLNEGFARYYQYFLTHWVEDYMGFETRFIVEQVHTSLLTDSANNPQPLSNPGVGSPAEVSNMFSTISYNKGAAVIRMTEHLLGFEVHRQGLRNYLATNYYGTVEPIDLFNALQEAAVATGAIEAYGPSFNIVDYYNSWTEQPGHPVLEVHVNHATGDMTIQQRRFNINTGYSSINTRYVVPISFSTASNPDFANTKPSHILTEAVTVINRGTVGDEWVLFNKQQTGFYRVNYDDYTWDLIILALRGPERATIHEYNKAQIVNDVFQFARSGLMTYTRAFNILSFLQYETQYAPWVAALTGFSWIRNRLAGTSQLNELEAMIVEWATPLMNNLTYEAAATDDFMRLYLRWQLAPVMCNMGVAACQQAAVAQFAALRDNGIEVHRDNRNFVYCNALRQGTPADFDFLWQRFQTSNLYTEKITILMTAGCTPHQASLNTFLDGIVQENQLVRPQDYTTAWNTAVTGNEGNTQLVFQYIQANLDQVTYAFNGSALPLSYVSARLRTVAEVEAFQTWATTNQEALGAAYTNVFNGAENSRQSIIWAAEVQSDIAEYIVSGDNAVAATEPPVVPTEEVTTETQPILVEPESPVITDAASSTFLSFFVITFALIAKFIY